MVQILANSVIAASGYVLVGIGFSLVYNTTKCFHFAHGMVLTIAAYTVFALRTGPMAPLWVCFLGGIAASLIVGVGIEAAVYRPLRKTGATPVGLLLASLGVYAALQAMIALAFGAATLTFRSGVVPGAVGLLGARITLPQVWMIASAGTTILLMWLWLQRTRLGARMRAVADDRDLAIACGIDPDRIALVTFAAASVIAGVGSILIAYDTDLYPAMGFRVLLMGIVAATIGGLGSSVGTAAGALILALAQNFGAWWFSSRWQDPVAFIILLLFLIARPQGIWGSPAKEASI